MIAIVFKDDIESGNAQILFGNESDFNLKIGHYAIVIKGTQEQSEKRLLKEVKSHHPGARLYYNGNRVYIQTQY